MSAGAGENTTAGDLVVPLHSRRRHRAQFGQKLQHLIPAAGLLFGGVQSLMAGVEGTERTLAIVGIITSALLMTAFTRHLRTLRPQPAALAGHGRHGIDWMDIWAAGVLFAEAAEKWRIRGHIWRPETLAAVATLAIGLGHGKLAARNERRRALRLTDDRLIVGRRFFGDFKASWDQIAEIVVTDREATIRTHQGKTRRLNLADLENAPAVRDALAIAQTRLDCARLVTP
jgi:hypothetical protein